MDKTLQILLKICAVFGVCLPTPKCCGPNGFRLFNMYIVSLMGILFFNSIYGIIKNNIMNEFIISWAVSTSVFISQMVTHFIIMYEAVTKHQEHTDFIRLVEDIDFYFKILLKMDAKTYAIIAEIRSNLIIMIVISKICLILFAVNFIFYWDAGYFWVALMAILAIRFRFFQVIMYADILKFYMLALNKKLNQVVCLKTEESKQLLDIDYRHLQSIDVIRNIKQIYASLYEASTLINEFAQASLFSASASSLLDITCHLYWILLALDNLLDPYNIISSMATIIPLAMIIFNFCQICQVLKDECQRTSLLLSRLVSIGVCSTVNESYKNLVHDFCLQLMHQRIEFTGNRFFTFDLKCVFEICALTATHLIILIQFTKSDTTSLNFNKTNVEAADDI